jgi:D-sedoheptulose 7-phosphate isomerase
VVPLESLSSLVGQAPRLGIVMADETGTARSVVDEWGRYSVEALRCIRSLNPAEITSVTDEFERGVLGDRCFFVIGNGGSAATASHFGGDLGRVACPSRARRVRALALTDSSTVITATANDLDYAAVFSYQLSPLLQPDDIVVALSAKGNSPNIVAAAKLARSVKARVVGILGNDGGAVLPLTDAAIVIDSDDCLQIENVQLLLCHFLAGWARARFGSADIRQAGDTPPVTLGVPCMPGVNPDPVH